MASVGVLYLAPGWQRNLSDHYDEHCFWVFGKRSHCLRLSCQTVVPNLSGDS